MVNITVIVLYILIFLFAIIYLNKDKLKTISLGFKKAKKEKYVKICSKCGSIDVQTDFSNPVVWAYGTTTKNRCNSCGYIAITFPEIAKDKIADFKENLKEENIKGKIRLVKEDLVDAKPGFYIGVYELTLMIIVVFFFLLVFLFSRT